MSISTIGEASAGIGGTATTLNGTVKSFLAKKGDILTTSAAGAPMFISDGTIQNTRILDGTSFTPASTITSLNCVALPAVSSSSLISTGAVTNLTCLATDENATVVVTPTSATTILRYSTNSGVTWNNTGSLPNQAWNFVLYSSFHSTWIVLGPANVQPQYTTTASFGSPWTSTTGGTFSGVAMIGGAAGGTNIVLHSAGTVINTSTNAMSWTAGTSPVAFTGIKYVNNQFFGFYSGSTGQIYTSPTGATWTLRTLGTTNEFIYDITYIGSTYYAMSNNQNTGKITYYTSTDGATWTDSGAVYVSGLTNSFMLNNSAIYANFSGFDGRYIYSNRVSNTGLWIGPYFNNMTLLTTNLVGTAQIFIRYLTSTNTYIAISNNGATTVNTISLGFPSSQGSAFTLTNSSKTTYAGIF